MDDIESRGFALDFMVHFILKLLNNASYDLDNDTIASEYEIDVMSDIIAEAIMHLWYNRLYDVLISLLYKLKVANGLYMLKRTSVIAHVIVGAGDHRVITDFLGVVIVANLKYEIKDKQIFVIAGVMGHVVMNGMTNSTIHAIKVGAQALVTHDMFHPDLINELINIHEMYHFVPDDKVRGQLLFFLGLLWN